MSVILFGLLLAAAPEAPATAVPAAPKEKMICKKQVETGSLVRGRKTCMTQSQWRAQATEAQEETARMQSANGGPGPQ